jgi:mRNA interferase HigB
MHVISRKALRQFGEKYPDSETALIRWFKLMNSANFQTFEELRSVFPSADLVDDLIVFNIGGNKYRLIQGYFILDINHPELNFLAHS